MNFKKLFKKQGKNNTKKKKNEETQNIIEQKIKDLEKKINSLEIESNTLLEKSKNQLKLGNKVEAKQSLMKKKKINKKIEKYKDALLIIEKQKISLENKLEIKDIMSTLKKGNEHLKKEIKCINNENLQEFKEQMNEIKDIQEQFIDFSMDYSDINNITVNQDLDDLEKEIAKEIDFDLPMANKEKLLTSPKGNNNYQIEIINCEKPKFVNNKKIIKINNNNNKFTLFYNIQNARIIRLFGSKFVQNNQNKCVLYINNEETNLTEFYEIKNNNENVLKIVIVINGLITDLSNMFFGCSSLISLDDFSKLNTDNINNMSYLFYNCSSLEHLPDISNWNISNVTNISFMFSGCSSLTTFPDISEWNLKNVSNMSNIFAECSSLQILPDISKWNIDNITDISFLFYGCSSLISLPDISIWNTNKINNMKGLFSFTTSLTYIPNISKWDTNKVINMSFMFHGCSLLSNLPDISKWKTNNVTNISYMFGKCSSIYKFPDISKWETGNITDMSYLFYNCSSITYLPDISLWDISKIINMSGMFYGCSSLRNLPNIANWNIFDVNLSYMFYGCSSLSYIPDISNWDISNTSNIKMMFAYCYSLESIPYFPEYNYYQYNELYTTNNSETETKIYLKDSVRNDILKYLPQIEMKFNNVNEFDQNTILSLKDELINIFKNENFSIIEIKKGSLTIILSLQYLVLKEIRNIEFSTFKNELSFENINEEIKNISNLLKKHRFMSLGTQKPDYVDNDILNINEKKNEDEFKKKILEISRNEEYNNYNLFEYSKNVEKEDLERFFQIISNEAEQQENNNIQRLIERLDEFNAIFDKEIEKAFENSIFEYKIIHIVMIERDTFFYKNERNNCPNTIIKVLFHGTSIYNTFGILSKQFNDANINILGNGVYFTDMLDYVWYYSGETYRKNFHIIPKLGDTFTFVASEIFYDKNKLKVVYGSNRGNVPKNGIVCAYANFETRILGQNELLNEYRNKKFIGNEYLITNKNQILPLYGITMKRVAYLVIWRDYNFNKENPNNYREKLFNEIQEFHRKIKKYISRELNTKIYYVPDDSKAIKLIERKKYNKIIIITNGNNNGYNFILKARNIIGSNAIAAVSAYDVRKHIKWVKNLSNVLILNGMEFHEKFFKCIKHNDKFQFLQLKKEIIDYYNYIEDFNLIENTKDLFAFPNFKNDGYFRDLTFERDNL